MAQGTSSNTLFPAASQILIAGGTFTLHITQIQTGPKGMLVLL